MNQVYFTSVAMQSTYIGECKKCIIELFDTVLHQQRQSIKAIEHTILTIVVVSTSSVGRITAINTFQFQVSDVIVQNINCIANTKTAV